MKRSLVVAMTAVGLVGTVGAIGSTAVAGDSHGMALAPNKTQPTTSGAPGPDAPSTMAPSSVPPLGQNTAAPTAPPTSSWLVTTPPTTMAPTTAPTMATTLPPVSLPAPTVAPAVAFDGQKWLAEVYAAVVDDPFTLIDVAERSVVINSQADLFIAHLLGVAIAEQVDAGIDPPEYTVTGDGKAVQVCVDDTKCDVFSDFHAPTGLLESFSINGEPLAVSVSTRRINVESLAIDSALCRSQSEGVLSCALLLTSEGASTALHWDQAFFTATDGRQFAPDLTTSVFSRSIADGGFGSAHLIFPGAPFEGEISLPIVSGMSGTPTVVSIAMQDIRTD